LLLASIFFGEFPLRTLYQDMYLSHIINGRYFEAFRVMSKVYYEVDPISAPRQPHAYCVNSLKELVGLVHMAQLEEWPQIPEDVRTVWRFLISTAT
jgi:hypothetical protein